MVMRPHTGGIDRHHPLRIIPVATALQTAQRPLPGPITRPCPMPAIHGLPRPVRPRQIPPRRARPGPPQNPVHHPPVRDPRTSLTARALHRKERFQPSPLLIGQIMTIMHATITPEPDPDLCQTRPRPHPSCRGRRDRSQFPASRSEFEAAALRQACDPDLPPLGSPL